GRHRDCTAVAVRISPTTRIARSACRAIASSPRMRSRSSMIWGCLGHGVRICTPRGDTAAISRLRRCAMPRAGSVSFTTAGSRHSSRYCSSTPARYGTAALVPRGARPGAQVRRSAAQPAGWTTFVSMQNRYNLVNREDEREMIPLCLDQGAGIIPYSPLARGLLAGTRERSGERHTLRSGTDDLFRSLGADFDVVD